jgi:hypothetical protein
MSTSIRVILSHLDSNGKTLTHFGQEPFLMTVASVDENGISTVLSNNNKKRGARIAVHSYHNLDAQHIVAANLLT